MFADGLSERLEAARWLAALVVLAGGCDVAWAMRVDFREDAEWFTLQ